MKGFTIDPMNPLASRQQLERTTWAGVEFRRGDRVRLRPRLATFGSVVGSDLVEATLAGRVATIAVIEQDYQDRIHLAVTIDDDDDSNRAETDLGAMGKIAHRFYFDLDEVEPLGQGGAQAS